MDEGKKKRGARVVFMGTPAFAVPSLEALIDAGHDLVAVVTRPDKPRGRGREPAPCAVKAAAVARGVKVLEPVTLRDGSFTEILKAMAPDVVAVVAYGRILPQDVLDVPPFGCVNLHASLLPKYRGAAPINWAIINGDRVTGVSTMLMDAGLDTGPVLLEEMVEIGADDTAEDLAIRLSTVGARLLCRTMDLLLDGRLKPRPQDESGATIAPVLTKDDGRIDWTRGAEQIRNQIRGLYPWPGAFTRWKKGLLKVHAARAASNAGQDATPGHVVGASEGAIDVACGRGVLSITELQPENKRRMSADEFIRGYRIGPGEKFI